MSRVVVAWNPLSAKASAAASISRCTVSGARRAVPPEVSPPVDEEADEGVDEVVDVAFVMVDSMAHLPKTKQALSYSEVAHAPQRVRPRPRGLPCVRPRVRRAEPEAPCRGLHLGQVHRPCRLARGRQAGPA